MKITGTLSPKAIRAAGTIIKRSVPDTKPSVEKGQRLVLVLKLKTPVAGDIPKAEYAFDITGEPQYRVARRLNQFCSQRVLYSVAKTEMQSCYE